MKLSGVDGILRKAKLERDAGHVSYMPGTPLLVDSAMGVRRTVG